MYILYNNLGYLGNTNNPARGNWISIRYSNSDASLGYIIRRLYEET